MYIIVSLLQLENNSYAEVVDIKGGPGFLRRLESMGIRIGCKILKISDTPGPVIIKVGNTQLAVGRGIASKIFVKKL